MEIRNERKRRVESGILPEPPLRSHPLEGHPLDERMALLGVSGVSVAVIADGKITGLTLRQDSANLHCRKLV